MFSYFFGSPVEEEEEMSLEPSYKLIKQRHMVMQQIKMSKLKLRKTFIVQEEYIPIGYNSYRFMVGVKK